MPRFQCLKCQRKHESKLAFSLSRCVGYGNHEVVTCIRPQTADAAYDALKKGGRKASLKNLKPIALEEDPTPEPTDVDANATYGAMLETFKDGKDSSTAVLSPDELPEVDGTTPEPMRKESGNLSPWHRQVAEIGTAYQEYREIKGPRPAKEESFVPMELIEPPNDAAVNSFLQEARAAITSVATCGKYSEEVAQYIQAKFEEFSMVCELE